MLHIIICCIISCNIIYTNNTLRYNIVIPNNTVSAGLDLAVKCSEASTQSDPASHNNPTKLWPRFGTRYHRGLTSNNAGTPVRNRRLSRTYVHYVYIDIYTDREQ